MYTIRTDTRTRTLKSKRIRVRVFISRTSRLASTAVTILSANWIIITDLKSEKTDYFLSKFMKIAICRLESYLNVNWMFIHTIHTYYLQTFKKNHIRQFRLETDSKIIIEPSFVFNTHSQTRIWREEGGVTQGRCLRWHIPK